MTNWHTTSVVTEEQSEIYKALHLCDYWGLCLASPYKSLMAKFSTVPPLNNYSYNMWLATKDIVAPYFDYVGIRFIESYTVTHHIPRHSHRLVREMLPVTEPGTRGLIMVRYMKSISAPSLPFKVYGPMRSTHKVSQGFLIMVFGGTWSYWSVHFLLNWQDWHCFT